MVIIGRYGGDGGEHATSLFLGAAVKPLNILHCHSTFSLGGKEARAVRLMNAFGGDARHTVLTAMPGAVGARDAIEAGIHVRFPDDAPSLSGKPSPGRYRRLSSYMRQFDLVLTYNWGSMDAVGARRLFPTGCPPLIHHEDGFNLDEAVKLNWKRSVFRQLMLPTTAALVVPSVRLERIAKSVWKQPNVRRIPNGIDVARYRAVPSADAIPGFTKQPSDVVVGTLAGLRAVKNLPRLVRTVAAQPAHVKLVIVGEGPERQRICDEATRLGIADRLLLPGFLPEPHRYVGLFDIFALSSDSEQFPISLVEAMAAGLPALSTDVGDVMAMISPENRDFIAPVEDEAAYALALSHLIDAADLRRKIGAANRAKASAEYDEAAMIDAYRALYWGSAQ
jgi:L-malate glycosyltransferase